MIGALLIIGGSDNVPFHMLPNPTDDSDVNVPSDNPYATSMRITSSSSGLSVVFRMKPAATLAICSSRYLPHQGIRTESQVKKEYFNQYPCKSAAQPGSEIPDL
jgi:hypothetical protein